MINKIRTLKGKKIRGKEIKDLLRRRKKLDMIFNIEIVTVFS
jgi:hypothetical protein